MANKTYFAIVPARDCGKTMDRAIGTLIRQTVKPEKIIVINDGSSDETEKITDQFIADFPDIVIKINTYSKTRDYTRIPHLWNWALQVANEQGFFVACDYHLISAGDVAFEPDYAKKILSVMENNTNLVVASGDFPGTKSSAPHGAGRFVRNDYFAANYGQRYPAIIGYESEILERVVLQKGELAVIQNARIDHLDKLGHSHNFKEFGYAMRALGYNNLFVIGRCVQAFVSHNQIGKLGTLRMLYYYLTYRPQKQGYYSLFDEEIRRAINLRQKKMMHRIPRQVAKAVLKRMRLI